MVVVTENDGKGEAKEGRKEKENDELDSNEANEKGGSSDSHRSTNQQDLLLGLGCDSCRER